MEYSKTNNKTMDGENDISEHDLYAWVIKDVVSKVLSVFIEDGKDESVLQELKELWEEKFQKTKAAEVKKQATQIVTLPPPSLNTLLNLRLQRPSKPHSPVAINRVPMTCTHFVAPKNILPTTSRLKPSEQMIIVHKAPNSAVAGQTVQVPQGIGQQVLFHTQPGLLPQVVAGNQSAVLNVQQVVRPVQILSQGVGQAPQRLVLSSPRIVQLQQPTHRLQTNLLNPQVGQLRPLNSLLNFRFTPQVNSQIVMTRAPVQPLVSALAGSNNIIQVNSIAGNQITLQGLAAANRTNILSPRLIISQPQRLRQVDGTPFTDVMDAEDDNDDDELVEQAQMSDNEAELRPEEEEEEEEEEESIDDVDALTLSDIEDIIDSDNLLLCLYDKVLLSSKGKFKLFLKFGVLCIEGKERVFKGITGTVE